MFYGIIEYLQKTISPHAPDIIGQAGEMFFYIRFPNSIFGQISDGAAVSVNIGMPPGLHNKIP
jgi:hypothetical protein